MRYGNIRYAIRGTVHPNIPSGACIIHTAQSTFKSDPRSSYKQLKCTVYHFTKIHRQNSYTDVCSEVTFSDYILFVTTELRGSQKLKIMMHDILLHDYTLKVITEWHAPQIAVVVNNNFITASKLLDKFHCNTTSYHLTILANIHARGFTSLLN